MSGRVLVIGSGGREHALAWAESFGFPMDGSRQNDLPQVAQFVAVQRKTRQVRAELASASGDPTAYEVRGALIALRREQQRWVRIGSDDEQAA